MRFVPSLFGAVLLVSINAVGLKAAEGLEWPQFRGPGGRGISSEKGLPTKWSDKENIVWKVELPGPGTSSPIIHGTKIFLTSYSGYNVPGKDKGEQKDLRLHVYCLNRSDGKLLWKKDLEPKLPEQDRIRDSHGYASSTPVVDAERLYVFFGKSGVFTFDHDGKQLWQADVGDRLNGWGSACSLMLSGDNVIVNASVESDTLFAFDRKTGKENWKVKGIRESWNTPILNPVDKDRTELIVAIQGKVLGLDPISGKEFWRCDTDISWYMVPSLVAEQGTVYCIGGRSGPAALAVRGGGGGDVTKSHRLWSGKKGSNVSSPILYEGNLYFMNDSAEMAFCVEAKSGNILYEQRVNRAGQVYSSPVLADGKIYYTSRTGKTIVVEAKPEYKELAVNQLDDRSLFHASPAVAGGRLFLRSDRYLYCIGEGK